MPGANSVTSNQETLHKDLEEVVRKYARTTFLRPIADHTREAFAEVEEFVKKFYDARNNGSPPRCSEDDKRDVTAPVAVILDSGCGTGESTIHIARRFPGIPVIGIDKSCARLNKAGNPSQTAGEDVPSNAFWIRAELLDFWRLALDHVRSGQWTIPYHAVYYPNPWPKQSEATRRFHMHPIFPTLLALGETIELRTNWEIYAREFAEAARIAAKELNGSPTLRFEDDERGDSHSGTGKTIKCESFDPENPETAFERKYKEAGQKLWRTIIKTE
ncbi:tRNA (guanine(46)-N(7))-methyltransferase TrmB [Fibrobacter sp.]|uniref:tRNA (guanine(46)-N(7))-methyltransferase TrmB n=1 Tax=Fibrobacter sp. TaxID=35828 RepID=UPI0038699E5F